jgi:hypothetical protein
MTRIHWHRYSFTPCHIFTWSKQEYQLLYSHETNTNCNVKLWIFCYKSSMFKADVTFSKVDVGGEWFDKYRGQQVLYVFEISRLVKFAQHHSTFTVQTVQSTTEPYLQYRWKKPTTAQGCCKQFIVLIKSPTCFDIQMPSSGGYLFLF